MAVEMEGLEFEIKTEAAGAADGVNKLKDSLTKLKTAVNSGTGLKESSNEVKSLRTSLASIKASVSHATEPFKPFGKVLQSTAKHANKLNLGTLKTVSGLNGIVGTAKRAWGALTGLKKRFDHLLTSLGRIAMYRAVRFILSSITKALRDGINNLYEYSKAMGGEFAQSMNSLATNALYLKNSFGAMASPLINSLAPAINYITGKIVNLLNLINQLIARLSGKGVYTAAKNTATAYKGVGDAASGAAKKLKSYTSGLDELNIISDDSGGGGGGGGGLNYGDMFEEVPIESGISEFADRIKQAFMASDWKSLGTIVGEKVNEVVNSIDYTSAGEKLGAGIHGILATTYHFLDTVDFTNIGARIAEYLNGAMSEIDFTNFGRLLVQKFTILADLAIGAILNLDWKKVGKSLSDIISGSLSEAIKWVRKYDWSQIGSDLWQSIKDFIAGVDWGGILTLLIEGYFTIMKGWASLLQGAWRSIIEDIVAYFTPFIENAGGNIILGLWDGITNALGNAWQWLKKYIFDPIIKGFCDLFGIHSPSTVMAEYGGYIIEGLLNGMLSIFSSIGTWIKKNIYEPLVEAIKKSPVVKFAVGVINDAKTWWSNVKGWWNDKMSNLKDDVATFAVEVIDDAKTWWSNVKSWWEEKAATMLEAAVYIKNESSTWWANVQSWWDDKAADMLSVGVSIRNEAAKWWENVQQWWKDTVTSLVVKVLPDWSGFGKGGVSVDPGFLENPILKSKENAVGGILDGAQVFGMIGNTLQIGGEAGREALLPLDTHTEWMDTLAERVRDGLPDGGGYSEMRRALADFYGEYVQSTMTQMASDMNKQANKAERTTVQIGNRTVNDAVTTQRAANGYAFAR